jgi:hypothetical protein
MYTRVLIGASNLNKTYDTRLRDCCQALQTQMGSVLIGMIQRSVAFGSSIEKGDVVNSSPKKGEES